MKIADIVKDFNKNKATKAKLVSSSKKLIIVEIQGKSEAQIEESMYALRGKLEQAVDESVLIQKIHKNAAAFRITFSIEKNPTKDILEILKRYEDGTMPRAGAFED